VYDTLRISLRSDRILCNLPMRGFPKERLFGRFPYLALYFGAEPTRLSSDVRSGLSRRCPDLPLGGSKKTVERRLKRRFLASADSNAATVKFRESNLGLTGGRAANLF
jgi:hypothetical protein